MEILTGGVVKAGFHQVSIVPETITAIERQKEKKRPLWRISSTLFFHTASDNILEPQGAFRTTESLRIYKSTTAGDQVASELDFINLSTK